MTTRVKVTYRAAVRLKKFDGPPSIFPIGGAFTELDAATRACQEWASLNPKLTWRKHDGRTAVAETRWPDGTYLVFAVSANTREVKVPDSSVSKRTATYGVVKAWNNPMRAPWNRTESQTLHLKRRGLMGTKGTLCGKAVSRSMGGIFQPNEATCKECLRRAGMR